VEPWRHTIRRGHAVGVMERRKGPTGYATLTMTMTMMGKCDSFLMCFLVGSLVTQHTCTAASSIILRSYCRSFFYGLSNNDRDS